MISRLGTEGHGQKLKRIRFVTGLIRDRPSNSVQTITDALRELSANTIARTPAGQPVKKVVVKLVYDRGTLEQVSRDKGGEGTALRHSC